MQLAQATVSFADLVDGIVKLAALVLVGYAVIFLLPTLRQRGFKAKIFGTEVEVDGAGDAVEKLSSNVEKQIDDLRAQVDALREERGARGVAPSAPSAPSAPTGTRTVLWVDDNPSNNLFEVAKLHEEGFAVTQVRSTDAAVKELQKTRFDLVISDMSRREHLRPVLDAGVRLTEWLRRYEQREGRERTPIAIYCSADAIKTHGDQARAAGASVVTASTTELLQALRDGIFRPPA